MFKHIFIAFLVTNSILIHAGINEDLLAAVQQNMPNQVLYCLAHRADINTKDQRGRTPLHLAILNNYPGLAHTLIERGASINAQTDICKQVIAK